MDRYGPYRLATGGQIDRTTHVPFQFDGVRYAGLRGDSLASALLANGVRIVGRSFKFHRPRGIFTCGVEEPHGLLQIGQGARAVPSARAPVQELYPGLTANAQSGWPSVRFDLGRTLDALAPLWAAGFYNKTFKWPNWHSYEGVIRRMAGLGKAPVGADPDRYETLNLHCDVLVVGAGRSGLAAATDAAEAGARVVLVEQDTQCGGRAAWGGSESTTSSESLEVLKRRLRAYPEVRVLTRTAAVGVYDHGVVTLSERVNSSSSRAPRERFWIVRTGRIILATGALEQPLIFANNDRPGIMLADAVRQYLLRYGVACGRRILLATNNDSVYSLARQLTDAGVEVAGVVDSRQHIPEHLAAMLQSSRIPLFARSIPTDTRGFSTLRQVQIGRLTPDVCGVESVQNIDCDALGMSGGFNPTLHLYAHAGGKLAFDDDTGRLRPVDALANVGIVGRAGRDGERSVGLRLSPVGDPQRQWVDFLHDVTVSDLALALRENFTATEHVKRYTTVGMAADQGKTATIGSLSTLAKLQGVLASQQPHTTIRPPFTSVTLGAIAGRSLGERFSPRRYLPLHDWHVANGAILQDFGGWQRVVTYPRAGESREAAVVREARAVRESVGLYDGSSLGKIEIRGPDALAFIDRFYINSLTGLAPGRVRYGLMLKETGTLLDDGTVVALAPDHILITTTSANAGQVHAWLEEWHQTEWPDLKIAIVPVTEQWATLSLAGPRARAILGRLPGDFDLSPHAFPHLTLREGTLLGARARVYRVSFTGELSYEINVPAQRAAETWGALLEAGASEGIQVFGLDALMNLRMEKGFLHVGADTDGTTVPEDVGWGAVARKKATDFIGKRSLKLPEHTREDRFQLVGLTSPSGTDFVVGSHLRLPDSIQATDGWITSAGRRVLTGEPLALCVLRGGRGRVGSSVNVYNADRIVAATVADLPFFDRSGECMRA